MAYTVDGIASIIPFKPEVKIVKGETPDKDFATIPGLACILPMPITVREFPKD